MAPEPNPRSTFPSTSILRRLAAPDLPTLVYLKTRAQRYLGARLPCLKSEEPACVPGSNKRRDDAIDAYSLSSRLRRAPGLIEPPGTYSGCICPPSPGTAGAVGGNAASTANHGWAGPLKSSSLHSPPDVRRLVPPAITRLYSVLRTSHGPTTRQLKRSLTRQPQS